MKKYKKIRYKGTSLYVPVEKKKDRPLFPRPAAFKNRKCYDRNREKEILRKWKE